MHHRRKLIGALGAITLQVPFGAIAQSAPAAPRVVLVIAGSVRTQPERVNAFRNRLRELGYVEGKNLTLEIREIQGRFDQLPKMMAEVPAVSSSMASTLCNCLPMPQPWSTASSRAANPPSCRSSSRH